MERIKAYIRFINVKYDDGEREIVAFFMYSLSNRSAWRGSQKDILRDGYAHMGQHSTWDNSFFRHKEATKEEYKDLLKELINIGYDVIIMNKDK